MQLFREKSKKVCHFCDTLTYFFTISINSTSKINIL